MALNSSAITAKTPFFLQLLATSLAASRHAGSLIRQVFESGRLAIVDKDIDDPQTEADRRAQACLVASLKKAWPELCIVAEEGELGAEYAANADIIAVPHNSEVYSQSCPSQLASVTPDQVVVWIDPLDGTKDFTEGLVEAVTVMVGIAIDGKPQAGVLLQPFVNDGCAVWGGRGLSVHGCPQPPSPSDPAPFTVITTRSHYSAETQQAMDVLKPDRVWRLGGCGNKFLALLQGKCSVYLYNSPGTKKWDTCAGEALLLEAGGFMTDIYGKCYKYGADELPMNQSGVIAALNQSMVTRCVEALAQVTKKD